MNNMYINEEVINNELFFYHSARDLQTAKYIINKQWRTSQGLYGNGIYGQQYPDPTSPENKLSQTNIDRYKNVYGGSYRFKIKYNNPKDIFYLDLDAGKEVYGPKYNKSMAVNILKEHNVPDNIISNIMPYFSDNKKVPSLSNSSFATYKKDGGLLGEYGFKGLVYEGNLDGKCVLFWYPNSSTVEVEAYSTDFGSTWINYDSNNVQQVKDLNSEIDAKIKQLSGYISNRRDIKQQDGKTPGLSIKGKDRDWIRIIECGDKSGYDFVNGDFTTGNLNKFAGFVQKQINASKEPKRSNRYNIAIKLIPSVQSLINL